MINTIGYIAMIICLVSMLQENIWKLRFLNSVACFLFVIYGLLIDSYPTVVLNVLVIIINVYKTLKSD